ncbi:MAG: hypothetical protein WCA45_07605 [Thiobacillaceae bacterium]
MKPLKLNPFRCGKRELRQLSVSMIDSLRVQIPYARKSQAFRTARNRTVAGGGIRTVFEIQYPRKTLGAGKELLAICYKIAGSTRLQTAWHVGLVE